MTDQHFCKIYISHYCMEQDFEVCAIPSRSYGKSQEISVRTDEALEGIQTEHKQEF
jgi:hypothetical protein